MYLTYALYKYNIKCGTIIQSNDIWGVNWITFMSYAIFKIRFYHLFTFLMHCTYWNWMNRYRKASSYRVYIRTFINWGSCIIHKYSLCVYCCFLLYLIHFRRRIDCFLKFVTILFAYSVLHHDWYFFSNQYSKSIIRVCFKFLVCLLFMLYLEFCICFHYLQDQIMR